MRRRGKVDANQDEIVRALRSCGCLVLSLAGVGGNVSDLLVRYRGRLFLLEVKMPGHGPTDAQAAWLEVWGGSVVRSPGEALRVVGAIR